MINIDASRHNHRSDNTTRAAVLSNPLGTASNENPYIEESAFEYSTDIKFDPLNHSLASPDNGYSAHILVSGMGVSGMLAALKLYHQGHNVTCIEKRTRYSRGIHLSLRQSFLDNIKVLDPMLHERVLPHFSPIEQTIHLNLRQPNDAPKTSPFLNDDPVHRRLSEKKRYHVVLNELEQEIYAYLLELDPSKMHLYRGMDFKIDSKNSESRIHRAQTSAYNTSPTLEQDIAFDNIDLVVVAEGGKSPSAQSFNNEMAKYSKPKHFLSCRLDYPLGPITKRVDTEADGKQFSIWLTGHSDPSKGCWVVIETPDSLEPPENHGHNDQALQFLSEQTALGIAAQPDGTEISQTELKQLSRTLSTRWSTDFWGHFKFEQQILETHHQDQDIVFFGDASGMGHHDLSAGLEMAMLDLRSLEKVGAQLQAAGKISDLVTYDNEVQARRTRLLSATLNEYYPELNENLDWVVDVASDLGQTLNRKEFVEFLIREKQAARHLSHLLPKYKARHEAASAVASAFGEDSPSIPVGGRIGSG